MWNGIIQLSNTGFIKTTFNVDFIKCRKSWTYEIKQLAADRTIDHFSSVETI